MVRNFKATARRQIGACALLVELESRHREAVGEAGAGLEGDFPGRRIVDVHLDDGEPEQELLGLHPGHLLHLALLHDGRHLGGVRHLPLDLLEGVVLLLLLDQPHEAGGLVVAELLDVVQREQAVGETELLQQLDGLLSAEGVAVVHLGALAVALDALRRHGLI